MKQCIFSFFILFTSLFTKGQDTIAVYADYVIYRDDTLNRFDINGKKNGIWLTYRTDSVREIRLVSHHSTPVYTSPNRPVYKAIGKGQYINGQRQGKWTFGSDDFKEIDIEVTYKDNKIVSPILFYTTDNQLWLKAEEINDKWIYFLWNKEMNSFIDTHQKYTFELLFDGYDFEE